MADQDIQCEFCHPSKDLIIKKTSNFSILYDPYPLNVGHFLITTHRHYGCGGELDDELMGELITIKRSITEILQKEHPHVIYYEHGRSGACTYSPYDGNICHHMHLHILPFHQVSTFIVNALPNPNRTIYPQVTSFFHNMGSYMYFEESNEQGAISATKNLTIPPHFFRTLLSKMNGTPERSNWKKYPKNGLLKASKTAFPRKKFISL